MKEWVSVLRAAVAAARWHVPQRPPERGPLFLWRPCEHGCSHRSGSTIRSRFGVGAAPRLRQSQIWTPIDMVSAQHYGPLPLFSISTWRWFERDVDNRA